MARTAAACSCKDYSSAKNVSIINKGMSPRGTPPLNLRQSVTLKRSASWKSSSAWWTKPKESTIQRMAKGHADEDSVSSRDLPDTINEDEWQEYAKRTSLFFPTGPLKFKWDLVMLALIVYSCVTVPFRIGMDHAAEGWWWVLEVIVSLCFLAEIFIVFNTAYLEGDQLVINRCMICDNYLRGWFWIDLPASFPVELFEYFAAKMQQVDDGSSANAMIRALRLMRLARVLRLLKLQSYIDAVEDGLGVNLRMLELVKVVAVILYLCHILGCLWFFLADTHEDKESTWLYHYNHGSGVDADVWTQYLYSVYWSLTTLTTVGYGDIVAKNDAERLYALCCMVIGAILFGYLMSTVADLLRSYDMNKVMMQRGIDEVRDFLRYHKFSPEMTGRVKRYFEFYHSQRSSIDEEHIIQRMAPALQRDVQSHLLKSTVRAIPLFSDSRSYMTLDLQLMVHSALKPLLRETKEIILTKNDPEAARQQIFFLRRGAVEAIADIPDVCYFEIDAAKELGAVIGETALAHSQKLDRRNKVIHSNRASYATFRALRRCELYALALTDLHRITKAMMNEKGGGNPESNTPKMIELEEMAKLIHAPYLKRMWARTYMLLFLSNAANPVAKLRNGKLDRVTFAALRLQAYWVRCQTRRATRDMFLKPYVELLPGLIPVTSLWGKARAAIGGVGSRSMVESDVTTLTTLIEQLLAADRARDASLHKIAQGIAEITQIMRPGRCDFDQARVTERSAHDTGYKVKRPSLGTLRTPPHKPASPGVEEKQLSVQLLLPAASAATLAVGERFTPGREEYRAIKETHSDCVICFKMGKFYELFEEDAVLGHSELDLAFIGKGAPHVGFPEAALPMYSQKLFERGYKVGVVSAGVFEQMESSSDTYSS